ncbi:hypothetical protein PsW74_00951 [Pseudovibrio sp. W74]|nr:hypothetical protein PsW74_00951 [Pseudovibrio sp. W74]
MTGQFQSGGEPEKQESKGERRKRNGDKAKKACVCRTDVQQRGCETGCGEDTGNSVGPGVRALERIHCCAQLSADGDEEQAAKHQLNDSEDPWIKIVSK